MSAEKEGKNMMNNFEAGARISPAGSHIKHNKEEEEERKKSIFFSSSPSYGRKREAENNFFQTTWEGRRLRPGNLKGMRAQGGVICPISPPQWPLPKRCCLSPAAYLWTATFQLQKSSYFRKYDVKATWISTAPAGIHLSTPQKRFQLLFCFHQPCI